MCGIAGVCSAAGLGKEVDPLIRRMVASLNHRGPDEAGIYIDPLVALGHARLSIIGLDDGTQPIGNEDDTLWIVFNGEVFNYLELRVELQEQGHCFKTSTDTEVVLHLFEEHGADGLHKLIGQFAFVIWNRNTRELFLARDRVGIRPLYYTFYDGQFLFASEIKALFQHQGIHREINPEALLQTFTFWAPLSPRTIFTDIYELPPGCCAWLNNGELQQERYWQIPLGQMVEPWRGSFDEAQERLDQLMADAVRLRLRADVPVGAYLSGGLDSSILTAIVAEQVGERLCTFSLGFENAEFDESSYQSEMVQYLSSRHQHVQISNQQVLEHFPEVIFHCEKPLLRTGPVPLLLLADLVHKENYKVVLTGEGADEVFGGYNIFKEAKVRSFWARRPESSLRPRLLEKLFPYVFKDAGRSSFILQQFYAVREEDRNDPLLSHRKRWQTSGRNSSLFSKELLEKLVEYDPIDDVMKKLPADFADNDYLQRAQYLEMSTFMPEYLLSSQGDRVAMAHAVELRVPFLDHRLIEFAATLPSHWKLKGLNEKYILKKTFQQKLPQRILARQKQPYRAPIAEIFFDKDVSDYPDDLLSETSLRESGLFHPAKVQGLVRRFRARRGGGNSETQNMALVGILSTQLLFQQFIKSPPIVDGNSVCCKKIIRFDAV